MMLYGDECEVGLRWWNGQHKNIALHVNQPG